MLSELNSMDWERLRSVASPRLYALITLSFMITNLASSDENRSAATSSVVRIATYNVSLYGKKTGEVAERLRQGTDKQARAIAAIVQTIRPDILLLNEIDHDDDAHTAKLLRDQYFAVGRDDRVGIEFPYVYSAPSNTGIASQIDLNGNGRRDDPEDAWGFGLYPGQYAFAILSRFPIESNSIRTFQSYNWARLPNALRPIDPQSQETYYSDSTWNALRLSSKNHVDVPINLNGKFIHILASHPTPPVFDGPEDRNGCRNHDEIAFWNHYLDGSEALVDDSGKIGGLSSSDSFVIMGDLNSDANEGSSRAQAIVALLHHPRVQDPKPQRTSNTATTPKNDAMDTADFGTVGEIRVDYVLPSADMKVREAKVFWPAKGAKGSDWIHASDHRLVWVDVEPSKPSKLLRSTD